jgi:hypothetical protein
VERTRYSTADAETPRRKATAAGPDIGQKAAALPTATRHPSPRAAVRTRRNRSLGLVLAGVALLVLATVFLLVIFLENEAAHPLAKL